MRKGFTLIEVLLVVSILLLMIGVMTGALNPTALINRARDVRRKKDIGRIKIAMEEYMNDKGYYPFGEFLEKLNNEDYCKSNEFAPYLPAWLCDPNGQTYFLVTEDEGERTSWFKVYANLENKNDEDIPAWWYDNSPGSYAVGDESLSNADVNFGTSSTNVLWYEKRTYDPYCLEGGGGYTGVCYRQEKGVVGCNDYGDSCEVSDEYDCFLDYNCQSQCQVGCCENGQSCD